METVPLVLLLVGGALVFAGAIVAFVFAIVRFVHRTSGLGRLLPLYAAAVPEGPASGRLTVKVGSTFYKNCAYVAMRPEGLYVWARSIVLKNPSVCIPWSQVAGVGGERLYWRQAMRLSIGRPEIVAVVLPNELMGEVQYWLGRQEGVPPAGAPGCCESP